MDKLFVTFRVEVTDQEYAYRASQRGSAEVNIQVPRSILENIDPGNLLMGALQAALADFDSIKSEGGNSDNA